MPARYRSNAPRFADETLDGEALIMDMVKGTYFSCLGASAIAWNELKCGASVDEVADSLATTYRISVRDASRDVERFLAALLAEEMLVEEADASQRPSPASLAQPVEPGEYSALDLERYTDLADLILLDPV